jgi:hypothetical protein
MAKTSKKSKEAAAPETPTSAPETESSNGHSAAAPSKAPVAKKRPAKASSSAQAAGKTRAAGVKKASAPRKPRGKKASVSASHASVTDDQIRLRAYFISEWRAKNGIAGDSAHDWIEARRQLQAEAARS